MGKFIRLKKGFTINLQGKASPKVVEIDQPETFVIKPTDFQGLYMPKPTVNVGDTVKAGTPLFHDKKHENVVYAAPVSGEIVEVKRGEKRKLLEIKILADKKVEYETFNKYSVSEIANLSASQLKGANFKIRYLASHYSTAVWNCCRSGSLRPKAIHISAFDTHPLAPDYSILFKGQDQYFQVGIDVLKKLTSGVVHINTHTTSEISTVFSQAKGAEVNKFSGPHPAGCVGVQIHHIDPINKGDVVWTINPFAVIQVGKALP
jgi:Na+-transporting NADH:ubiquinone oxidoreductase subunit A